MSLVPVSSPRPRHPLPTPPRSVAVNGDLYLFERHTRIRRTFRGRTSTSGLARVEAIVKVGNHRFQIYATRDTTLPLNELLVEIKGSTLWQGELAVFILGKRVSYLSKPGSVRRTFHNQAISLFISRMVEAIDLEKPLPKIIM